MPKYVARMGIIDTWPKNYWVAQSEATCCQSKAELVARFVLLSSTPGPKIIGSPNPKPPVINLRQNLSRGLSDYGLVKPEETKQVDAPIVKKESPIHVTLPRQSTSRGRSSPTPSPAPADNSTRRVHVVALPRWPIRSKLLYHA